MGHVKRKLIDSTDLSRLYSEIYGHCFRMLVQAFEVFLTLLEDLVTKLICYKERHLLLADQLSIHLLLIWSSSLLFIDHLSAKYS